MGYILNKYLENLGAYTFAMLQRIAVIFLLTMLLESEHISNDLF
jgi:hypothetical protein